MLKNNKSAIQFNKFIFVGGANFLMTLIIFYAFVEIINANYIISLFLVSAIGWIFTYIINYIWTFKPQPQLIFGSRFLKYLTTGLASVALNAAALHVLVNASGLPPFWAQLCLVPFVILLNFASAKFWSLRPS